MKSATSMLSFLALVLCLPPFSTASGQGDSPGNVGCATLRRIFGKGYAYAGFGTEIGLPARRQAATVEQRP